MSTLISSTARVSSIARAGRAGLAGPAGRRTVAVAAALLVAGALAAGCGSAHSSVASGSGVASGGTASNAAPGHATVPAAPSASATPVPTVSGGTVASGQSACVGWPTDAASASLPVSFVPVSVERCVSGAQTIPGKGLWTTATLQRADSGLAGLISALRQPPVTHRPGTVCPAVAVIPPQVVLIDANGRKLTPRLPASGCGLTQSQVLLALNKLRWQPVSVRLIAKVPGPAAPAVSGTAPHSIQTVSGVQPQ
jgi:hypothetical protein